MDKKFILLIPVLLLSFALVGCDLKGTRQGNQNANTVANANQAVTNLPVNQPIVNQPAVPASAWKTYTSKLGVSLEYPLTSGGRTELPPSRIQKIEVSEKQYLKST